jgi:hypothetical protein
MGAQPFMLRSRAIRIKKRWLRRGKALRTQISQKNEKVWAIRGDKIFSGYF